MSNIIKRWVLVGVVVILVVTPILWGVYVTLQLSRFPISPAQPKSDPLTTTQPDEEQDTVVTLVDSQPAELIMETDVKWLMRATVGLGFNPQEFPDVIDAAKVNGCWTRRRLALLLAIRKQEAGGPGIEYGIVCKRGSSYRVQAGWCAATISKFLDRPGRRWINEFEIRRLAQKYTPEDRPGIWADNVIHWYTRLTAVFRKTKPHPEWDDF